MDIISNGEHLSNDNWGRLSPVRKADFTIAFLAANGGLMEPEQAKQFWEIAIKGSERLRSYSTIPMKADTFKLDRFGFTGDVLHAGVAGQALPVGQRTTPTLGQTTLNPKLYKASVHVQQEVFEDNIMQERLRQFIMTKLTMAVRRDMLKIQIQSDTTSTNNDLAQFDGIIKSITSHVKDASSTVLTKTLLEQGLQELPEEYHDFAKLVFTTSTKSCITYVGSLSDRATEAGDQRRETNGITRLFNIPIESEMLYPNNIGSGSVKTVATLFDPKNWHIGLHRDVRLKMDEDIEADVFLIVVSVRFDGAFANEDASSVIINVNPTA